MMLIGLTGYAQHGKDSVAEYLKSYDYTRFAFADQLKELALLINPIIRTFQFPKHPERLQPLVAMLGWEAAKQSTEVRRFLQELGTGVRDTIGSDAWVSALDQKLRSDMNFWTNSDSWLTDTTPTEGFGKLMKPVVITDVRFPNEAAYVRRLGGVVWRVVRLNEDGTDFDNGIGTSHPSESWVATIRADDTLVAHDLASLKDEVERAVQRRAVDAHG